MKVICPMCDGNSLLSNNSLEISLDCDWCGGQGSMEESENRFYADEETEAEFQEQKCQPGDLVDSPSEVKTGYYIRC